MKILITTDNFLPRWDGIARFLNEIIPRMKGHEITVIAPFFGKIRARGFTLVQLPLSQHTFSDYTLAHYPGKRMRSFVKDADIVFNQTLGPIGVSAILAAKKLRKPIVSFTHSFEWELFPRAVKASFLSWIIHPVTKIIARRLYNNCTALIVPSATIAEHLAWHHIKPQKRVAQLGVDTDQFKPGSKGVARKKLKLPQDAFIIGYHGRIAKEKNLITLLRAFIRLDIPNKKLLVVGDGVDSLKHKLDRKDIIVTGMKKDVLPYLQAMDVYVLPSLTETTSLSVLEAMACGLPVISSRVGYVSQYIKKGQNGFFFDMHNPYDLQRKIFHVKNLDVNELTKIKAAARATVTRDFRWERTAKNILAALQEFRQTT